MRVCECFVLVILCVAFAKSERTPPPWKDPENELSANFDVLQENVEGYKTQGQNALDNFPLVDGEYKQHVKEINKGFRVLGEHALNRFPLVDGHNDLAMNLNRLYKNQLKNFDFNRDIDHWQVQENCSGYCQTDLPKLKEGKVGAQFWSAYIDCSEPGTDPVANTIEQIDVIRRLVHKYPNDLMFATQADDIERAFKQKKIASFIGVEGGHSIANKLSVLRAYYELGVRYLTLTHTCNTLWADSANADIYPHSKKKNLTEFGKKIVLEMNRLGMMVDISHVSKGVMLDVLKISRAPVIFSHSSSKYMRDHVRNVDDEVLAELKKNGGIIMVNFVPEFLDEYKSGIANVVNHIEHIVDQIGFDHVGIGGDFDGIKNTARGLQNVSRYPKLFNLIRGMNMLRWSLPKLEKVAGRNFVRVMKRVEQVRDELAKAGEEIREDILEEDFYVIPVA